MSLWCRLCSTDGQAVAQLGMPECDVVLAQCVAYLARAPKSVAVYRALQLARVRVHEPSAKAIRQGHPPRPSTKAMTAQHSPLTAGPVPAS